MRRISALGLAALAALALSTLACDDGRVTELEADLETQRQSVAASQVRVDESSARIDAQTLELEAKDRTIAELEAKLEKHSKTIEKLEKTKGGLESKLEQKEAALAAVKTLQDALSKSLVEEIETGDIRVSQRDNLLVVDVADTVLFGVGEAELSERGQQVLERLASSLIALPDQAVFQVGGHTDNQAIKSDEVKAKFPTNWELSAARATNVVRYLEESAKVPGKRLVAAGFSAYRPVASNSTAKGRAKNRRIEIALLPIK
jgi:chemotaxis protein MotB